ncbi:MAG: ABC-type polysaccharide/polyol phosphate export system, permease component, partial [Noviherbaspirillum sp.]|nr:ABC-type polysaccharide/polyol phosphate export system, permease component [Noviherbaspirillum sp.]
MPTLNPLRAVAGLYRHRYLIAQLTRRDVLLKYRGSYLGIGWSFLYPLFLLLAFTFVFGTVFRARWPQPEGQATPLVLIMYCGLIVFNIFSEVAGAAPRLIHGYQNYVKKIIFPVEVLPVVLVSTACIHAVINLVILIIAVALAGELHATILLTPIVLLPMILFAFGIGWLLAAAGVFVRDLVHVMPIFVQVFMFLSPVFYAVSVVPEYLQWAYRINPLSMVIENLRRVALWGEMPQW